jgi:hypothetical protein
MTTDNREIVLPKANAMADLATAWSAGAGVKLSIIAGLFLLTIATQASAGCGGALAANPNLRTGAASPSVPSAGHLSSAVYRPGTEGRFLLTSDDGAWPGEDSIVGMWRFELVTPGPTGTPVVVDDGYSQWHADGTEIQNSGLHAPITSNFCLGVWQPVGHGTYKLNHFPLGWDATGQNPVNAIQITETVKLTDEDHMTGTFTIKVYPWVTTDSLNVAGPAVATVTGTVTATRVTINSTVPGLE